MLKLMANYLQVYTKSDQQFQIRSDLNFMTISLQTHTKTPYELKFVTKNLPSVIFRISHSGNVWICSEN
jgi:hypothetical protein